MIALAENGSIPYPEKMQVDNANWSYFMPWNGEFTMPINGSNDNTAADWDLIMNDDYIITLENMPGWENYNPTEVEDNKAVQALVYPTRVKDAVYVICPDTRYSIYVTNVGGRLIHFFPAISETSTISCSDWDSGIYFISVITDNGQRTFPAIKVK